MRNLFENMLPTDNCPMCGAAGCSCNSYLNTERILNLETGALILVTEDIYEEVDVNGKTEPRLKWRPGEFITAAEAERLGVRQVPMVVRLNRERSVLKEALAVQGMGENKSLGATAENKQAFHPAENKSEQPVEDKEDVARAENEGMPEPQKEDDK